MLAAFDTLAAVELPAFDTLAAVELPAFDTLPAVELPAFDTLAAVELPAFDTLAAVELPAFDTLPAVELPAFDTLPAVLFIMLPAEVMLPDLVELPLAFPAKEVELPLTEEAEPALANIMPIARARATPKMLDTIFSIGHRA